MSLMGAINVTFHFSFRKKSYLVLRFSSYLDLVLGFLISRIRSLSFFQI
jgi:hypothetical protein